MKDKVEIKPMGIANFTNHSMSTSSKIRWWIDCRDENDKCVWHSFVNGNYIESAWNVKFEECDLIQPPAQVVPEYVFATLKITPEKGVDLNEIKEAIKSGDYSIVGDFFVSNHNTFKYLGKVGSRTVSIFPKTPV